MDDFWWTAGRFLDKARVRSLLMERQIFSVVSVYIIRVHARARNLPRLGFTYDDNFMPSASTHPHTQARATRLFSALDYQYFTRARILNLRYNKNAREMEICQSFASDYVSRARR